VFVLIEKGVVMAGSSSGYSSLYNRLLMTRRVVPLLASLSVIAFEILEHGNPFRLPDWTVSAEILIFGVIGPGLTFLVFTWLIHRVAERDAAESRLAVAIAQGQRLLAQIERVVRTERLGLVPTLEHILTGIAMEHSLTAAAVYLLHRDDGDRLAPAACWPTPEAGTVLAECAQAILEQSRSALTGCDAGQELICYARDPRLIGVPITGQCEVLGMLVLSGRAGGEPLESSLLGVVASAIALLIRNHQLYARLQSQAVLEERNELAREVHDNLAQSLGFVNFKAQHVQRLLNRGLVSEASGALEELCEGSQEVYAEVREMIQRLRSSVDVLDGLASRLQQYGEVQADRTGLEITVDAPAEPNLSPDAQLQLFRVAQEALSNVRRHAKARRVLIRLKEGPDGVMLSVEDDGSGLPSVSPGATGSSVAGDLDVSGPLESSDHFGLRIMRERVQSIGGEMQLESRPTKGTVLRVLVPAASAASTYQENKWIPSEF
jgi:signal transduction histidine kinase